MTQLRPVTHRLVGHPTEVGNVLRAAHARGHLLRCGQPEPINRHRVAVAITMLEPARIAPNQADTKQPGRRWLRHTGIVAGSLAAAGVLSGLLWLLAIVVQWVIANWVPLACLGFVVLVLAALTTEDRR